MALFKKSVRARVMEIVNKRIEDAEERYASDVKEITNETTEAVNALIESSNHRKEIALGLCVDSVLN